MKKIKCKEKSRSVDIGGVQEEYEEPPVDIDTSPVGKNITLAIPPKETPPKSIKLPEPNDDYVDVPPYDSASGG